MGGCLASAAGWPQKEARMGSTLTDAAEALLSASGRTSAGICS
jgi:hypothetical protein